MKKAIVTRELQPTMQRGRRIKAVDADGNNVTINCSQLSFEERHRAGAVALCKQMGWATDNLIEGYVGDGHRVFVEDDVRGELVQALRASMAFIEAHEAAAKDGATLGPTYATVRAALQKVVGVAK